MKIIIGTYRADKDMIRRCLYSLEEHVTGIDGIVFVDDSGNQEFREWLSTVGPGTVVPVAEDNAGYAPAMQKVCELMQAQPEEYVAFWEEDFVAVEPFNLNTIAEEMGAYPNLCQVVLVRQPWFENETAVGSMLVALDQRRGLGYQVRSTEGGAFLWLHEMTFSCNPAVWGPQAYQWGWPQCNDSEDAKTEYLLADDAIFGFWGNTVRVHHDGERSGKGY